MTRKRWLMLLLLLPALVAVQLTLVNMDDGGGPTAVDRVAVPSYTANHAEFTRFDSLGDPVLKGNAETIVYFDDQSAQSTQLHLDALRHGDVTWQLDSPNGSKPAHQNRYLLPGPVHISGRWPDTGEPLGGDTTDLWVDPEIHQFFSAAAVSLRSTTRTGDAVGLRADWQSHQLELLQDVRTTYEQNH